MKFKFLATSRPTWHSQLDLARHSHFHILSSRFSFAFSIRPTLAISPLSRFLSSPPHTQVDHKMQENHLHQIGSFPFSSHFLRFQLLILQFHHKSQLAIKHTWLKPSSFVEKGCEKFTRHFAYSNPGRRPSKYPLYAFKVLTSQPHTLQIH